MHRVVTDVRDHRGNRKLDTGPWLKSSEEAENWAKVLRDLGYQAHVEGMNGAISSGVTDGNLTDALNSMA